MGVIPKLLAFGLLVHVTLAEYRCINRKCFDCPSGTRCGRYRKFPTRRQCSINCPIYHCSKSGECTECTGVTCLSPEISNSSSPTCDNLIPCEAQWRCANEGGNTCIPCIGDECDSVSVSTFQDAVTCQNSGLCDAFECNVETGQCVRCDITQSPSGCSVIDEETCKRKCKSDPRSKRFPRQIANDQFDGFRCDPQEGTCIDCVILDDPTCGDVTQEDCELTCVVDPTMGSICDRDPGFCQPCELEVTAGCQNISQRMCNENCEHGNPNVGYVCDTEAEMCSACTLPSEDPNCLSITQLTCISQCSPDITSGRTYCQCGLGCQPCTDLACLGNVISYGKNEDCSTQCVQKYFCGNHGLCHKCCGVLCPHYAKTFDSEEQCSTECVNKYFCSSNKCVKCHDSHCPTLAYESNTECREECYSCSYGEWGHWSRCSAPCNWGRRIKTRSVLNGYELDCEDTILEEPCGQRPCPINCRVTHWTEWGQCIGSCNHGRQIRRRFKTNPQLFGGFCPVDKYVESRFCTPRSCGGHFG